MAYKTRLSWFGWTLVAPLLAVDLGSLLVVAVQAWLHLSAGQEAGWVPDLFFVVVLLNFALLPLVLLSLRLRRVSDYV